MGNQWKVEFTKRDQLVVGSHVEWIKKCSNVRLWGIRMADAVLREYDPESKKWLLEAVTDNGKYKKGHQKEVHESRLTPLDRMHEEEVPAIELTPLGVCCL